jgi:protoporphyrinogen oxidase
LKNIEFDHVISSIPIPYLVNCLVEKSNSLIDLISNLKYRSFITVLIVSKGPVKSDAQWIYIQDDNFRTGRIQIYNNWSSELVVDSASNVSFGVEYFCNEGDDVWSMKDTELSSLAMSELLKLKLISENAPLIQTKVIRVKKAYPVYDLDYKNQASEIKKHFQVKENLHLIGRNGMHRYNNQDHSIMTAKIVIDKILYDNKSRDQWKVNEDAEYLEDG